MNAKSVLFLLCSVFLSAACAQNQKPVEAAQTDPPVEEPGMVGNDRDEHGCIPSAGYQWSALRGECIRIFEVGVGLDPKEQSLDQSLAAFVVFKSDTDDQQVELYLPGEKKPVLLTKGKGKNAESWNNKAYTLSRLEGMFSIKDNKGKLLYEGAANR